LTPLCWLGFLRSKPKPCVYYKHDGSCFLVTTLYAGDMLFFGNSKDVVFYLNSQLLSQFDIKDLVDAKYILGMDIRRYRINKIIWLS